MIEKLNQPSSHRLDIAPPGDATLRCGLCLVRIQPHRLLSGSWNIIAKIMPDSKLTSIRTFLLLDQRTCQRLARQRSPGNSLYQMENLVFGPLIWQPEDPVFEEGSAQKHRSMVIEAMSSRRPKNLVWLNIFKKWKFSLDEHFQTREVLQSTGSR